MKRGGGGGTNKKKVMQNTPVAHQQLINAQLVHEQWQSKYLFLLVVANPKCRVIKLIGSPQFKECSCH